MKVIIIDFLGSNRALDTKQAFNIINCKNITIAKQSILNSPTFDESYLDDYDLLVLVGGFSYGDHLRAGAIAANTLIAKEIIKQASKGKYILGICNGFQILTELKLLPGSLISNFNRRFICDRVFLKVVNRSNPFFYNYSKNEIINIPIAHMQGNYYASSDEILKLKESGNIVIKYCDSLGNISQKNNPNGSIDSIAGIKSSDGKIVGIMPHFENCIGIDAFKAGGLGLFSSIKHQLASQKTDNSLLP